MPIDRPAVEQGVKLAYWVMRAGVAAALAPQSARVFPRARDAADRLKEKWRRARERRAARQRLSDRQALDARPRQQRG